ncbi:NAD-dependent epimerase/dehydratase family protein [Allobranchiibius sp. GilTou73]|uniref:NAD-dependent epimerase/dehydratase family protein n=1 Tax=Allobranchiibius sp. GilTou73 TaxID=2904523 RepID=UPI001F3C91C7|nr:NAD-dependent epimerase/dehydratase family protein [Allobranchiibius sp. GilTou73]UIJ36269.1 NAD-dependent epimerase/dehydratase family protein [Allobranchiibius sp. GilTou73]
MATILVTGGAGFIGSNFTRAALAAGHTVRVLDDLSTGLRDNLGDVHAEVVIGSLTDPEVLAGAVAGVEHIVHLGAIGSVPSSVQDPVRCNEVNVTGTVGLIEAARAAGVRHVVFFSSSAVYGANPATPIGERDWVRPMSPYGASKLSGEQYLLAAQQSYGLQTLVFRPFNVYGPGQRADHAYAAVIPAFLDATLAGRPLRIEGDGEQTRDFLFVATVCRVLLAAVERGVWHPEPVNLAYSTQTSINDLVSAISVPPAHIRRWSTCPVGSVT